jgi:hypothetical protein
MKKKKKRKEEEGEEEEEFRKETQSSSLPPRKISARRTYERETQSSRVSLQKETEMT